MAYLAENIPVHEYSSFDGEAGHSKGVFNLKPSKKWAVVLSVTLALGVYIGMMGCFGWVQHEVDNTSLQAAVAQQMQTIFARPEHAADAKLLSDSLNAANANQDVTQLKKRIKELTANKEFIEAAKRVAARAMADPTMQAHTKRLDEQMKTAKATSHVQKKQALGRRLLGASPLLRSKPVRPLSIRAPQVGPSTGNRKRDTSVRATDEETAPQASTGSHIPLLSALGQKGVATAVAESGLLSSLEKSGTFSSLEKAGAFSTAEGLLPLGDTFGVPGLLQSGIDNPGGLAAPGALLALTGPLFAGAAATGNLPQDVPVTAAGVLLTATTAVGVTLIALSGLVGEVGSGVAKTSNTPLLSNLGKAKAATVLAQTGLLSDLEKSKTFSGLEEAGAFSFAESLLPTIDKLGLAQFGQQAIDNPGSLSTTGAALIALLPLYVVFGSAVPDPDGPLAILPALTLTGTTGIGLVFLVTSSISEVVNDPEQLADAVKFVGSVRNPIGEVFASPGTIAANVIDRAGRASGTALGVARANFVTLNLAALFLAFLGVAAVQISKSLQPF